MMSKSAAWLLTPLLMIPAASLFAQEQRPPVDTITPVPAPEITPAGGIAEGLQMPKNISITNNGDISGSPDTGIRYGGPVHISADNGLEIFANTAALDLKTKTVTLNGDVSIYQGNLLQRGDSAVYHYEDKRLETSGLRASLDPILLESGKFTAEDINGRKVFVGKDAGVTTHDVADPNYWVRASETRIYPGDKVVFENLKVYAGDIPVFWFPYLAQPLDSELGYHFLPGSTSHTGPFLLNTYGIMLGGERDPNTGDRHDAWLLSQWRFDLRANRGAAVGLNLADTRSERSEAITGFNSYYLYDQDPSYSRSGVVRNPINKDRYSFGLKHRQRFGSSSDVDWRIDSNLTLLSDEYYLEDLNEDLFRYDPAPDNTVGIYRHSDSSLLSLVTRYQVNDFYRADSRMPEVSLDLAPTPLFDLPFGDNLNVLHEGRFSVGLIGETADDITSSTIINPLSQLSLGDPGTNALLSQLSGYERRLALEMISLDPNDPRREQIRTQLNDTSYGRLHAYEQLSIPLKIGEHVTLTPQAGIGYTQYSAVEGPGEGFDRTHLHAGAEASMKFSRNFDDMHSEAWGINGLLHVFQPYTAWSYISTDDYEAGDPGVDRLTPTTRPRTLDPIRFAAIDQMDNWNILRLGGRNRLITRRDNQSFEWLHINSYIDIFVDNPEDSSRNFSNLYNDIQWQPVPWMSQTLETQFPIADSGSGYSDIASRTHFMPSENFHFSFGYRWLKGHPFLADSSRIDLTTYTRLTENWGAGTRHSIELDDGVLEHQQYSLHRDLGNWVCGTGLYFRDNRIKEEYGLMFTITLKDFPSASLPFGYDAQ